MLELDKFISRRWQSSTRYYNAEIIQDIFGTWILRRSWGGLNSKKGNWKECAVTSYEEAVKSLIEIENTRKKRGYDQIRYKKR